MVSDEQRRSWWSGRSALIVAVVLVVLVRELVPFGRQALYPFTLFGTWVHEMGHGLTGLVLGGTFEELDIFWNASGLARGAIEPGWRAALRAAGGLLAPPLVGAVVLGVARGPRRAAIVLWTLGAVMLLSVPLWVRTLVGWLAVPGVALLLGLVAYKCGERARQVAAQGVGLLLAFDTVGRIDYLFTSSVTIGGRQLPSDVSHVAEGLGGHYLLWGVLLAAISLGLLGLGLWAAWRPSRNRPGPADAAPAG